MLPQGISATKLARKLGDVLGRVRYGGSWLTPARSSRSSGAPQGTDRGAGVAGAGDGVRGRCGGAGRGCSPRRP